MSHYLYHLIGADDALLYVGLTRTPELRMRQHRSAGVEFVRHEIVASSEDRAEAEAMEREMIAELRPPLNTMVAKARRPPKRTKDNAEYHGMVRRMIRAYARRVDKGDVTTLRRFRELEQEINEHVKAAAQSLHDQGFSWTEIANELGVSRQAARQRFMRQHDGLSQDVA